MTISSEKFDHAYVQLSHARHPFSDFKSGLQSRR